ncbi:hypothetical protein D3C73_1365840 [compost metagenome]
MQAQLGIAVPLGDIVDFAVEQKRGNQAIDQGLAGVGDKVAEGFAPADVALFVLQADQYIFQGMPGSWGDALALATVLERYIDNEGVDLDDFHGASTRTLARGVLA